MQKRKNSFIILLIQLVLILSLIIVNELTRHKRSFSIEKIAADLLITDLCLTTESRHTRHPALPDVITPFQDLAGGLDHFPSSTFIQVPAKYIFPQHQELDAQ